MNEADRAILADVTAAFAHEPRPEAFTNHPFCSECAEHDETLQSRDLETLSAAEVGSPAWDPVCMMTAEAWRYYLPALCRIALEGEPIGYIDQLLFHLISDGPENRRVVVCTAKQRAAITRFLWHFAATREQQMDGMDREDLLRAIEIWDVTPGTVSTPQSGV